MDELSGEEQMLLDLFVSVIKKAKEEERNRIIDILDSHGHGGETLKCEGCGEKIRRYL